MSVSDVGRRLRHVAVGTTREDAAAAFGVDHDEVLLTTYAELTAEVDLDRVISLDLAAGEALGATLDTVCQKVKATPGFMLRVEYAPGDSASLNDVLDRHAIAISDVQARDRRFLLTLEGASSAQAHSHVVLSALDSAAAALAERQPPEGRLTALEPSPDSVTGSPRPTDTGNTSRRPAAARRPGREQGSGQPRPPLLRVLDAVGRLRGSRRQRAMIVTGLAALVLVLLVVGFLADPSAPFAGVLLAWLVILVLAMTGVCVMTVLLLARQLQARTRRIERLVLSNRAVLDNRITGVARDVRALVAGQERLPFLRDLLDATAAAEAASSVRITDQLESLQTGAAQLHLDTQRQVQALLNLHRLVQIHDRVPPMGGWAASADFNVLMLQELISVRPRTVVECGSGTSTLLLALAVKQYDLPTRVVALEHLATHKAATESALREHGVADFAEVRLAPLSPVSVPDHATPWYAEERLRDLDDIGLLVVDGPPGTTGEAARYPAVALLSDRLSARCTVLVDDLDRESDLEVAQSWRPLLPDFEFELLDTLQKHAGVLRRPAGSAG